MHADHGQLGVLRSVRRPGGRAGRVVGRDDRVHGDVAGRVVRQRRRLDPRRLQLDRQRVRVGEGFAVRLGEGDHFVELGLRDGELRGGRRDPAVLGAGHEVGPHIVDHRHVVDERSVLRFQDAVAAGLSLLDVDDNAVGVDEDRAVGFDDQPLRDARLGQLRPDDGARLLDRLPCFVRQNQLAVGHRGLHGLDLLSRPVEHERLTARRELGALDLEHPSRLVEDDRQPVRADLRRAQRQVMDESGRMRDQVPVPLRVQDGDVVEDRRIEHVRAGAVAARRGREQPEKHLVRPLIEGAVVRRVGEGDAVRRIDDAVERDAPRGEPTVEKSGRHRTGGLRIVGKGLGHGDRQGHPGRHQQRQGENPIGT